MRLKTLHGLLIALLVGASACGDDGDENTDETPDTIESDAAVEDVSDETSDDADAEDADADDADLTLDVGPDDVPDAALDVVADVPEETGFDADEDTAVDAVEDTPDVSQDVSEDVLPDVAADVDAESDADAAGDTVEDAVADADAVADVAEDTSEDTSRCGNGIINGGEACDSENLRDQTCELLGFDGGELSCAACAFDTSACTGGDAAIDGGGFETLDDWMLVGDVVLTEEGALLTTESACEPASISQDVDFRAVSETEDVALAIRYRLTSTLGAQVFMDESPIGTLQPAEDTQLVHLCVNRGWYTEANLRMELLGPYADCSVSDGELLLESVAVVSDVRCDGFVGGDFEQVGGSPPLLPPWGIIVDHATSTGALVVDEDEAAAGAGAVALTLTGHCGIASISFSLASPELADGDGLGISFQARGNFDATSASAIALGGGGFDIISIDESETWTRYLACLGAPPAGTLIDFGVSIFGTDLCDEATFEPETLWVDEVTIASTAACL